VLAYSKFVKDFKKHNSASTSVNSALEVFLKWYALYKSKLYLLTNYSRNQNYNTVHR